MADDSSQQAVASPPKPQRSARPTKTGVVTGDGRDKTITVKVEYLVRHAKYGKYLRRRTVLHVHDRKNEAVVGDMVEIGECRPISKTKHWRLLRVLSRGEKGRPA